MTEKPNNGGSAFPIYDGESYLRNPGMSLLDHFAGQALAGMVSNSGDITNNKARLIATTCYMLAEAMVREKESRS